MLDVEQFSTSAATATGARCTAPFGVAKWDDRRARAALEGGTSPAPRAGLTTVTASGNTAPGCVSGRVKARA